MFYFPANRSLGIHRAKISKEIENGGLSNCLDASTRDFWLETISYKGQQGRDNTWQQNVHPATENFKGQTASDLLLYVNFTVTKEQMFWRD